MGEFKVVKTSFINKNNKQRSLTIPTRKIPKSLRYDPNLLFEIRIFKDRNK